MCVCACTFVFLLYFFDFNCSDENQQQRPWAVSSKHVSRGDIPITITTVLLYWPKPFGPIVSERSPTWSYSKTIIAQRCSVFTRARIVVRRRLFRYDVSSRLETNTLYRPRPSLFAFVYIYILNYVYLHFCFLYIQIFARQTNLLMLCAPLDYISVTYIITMLQYTFYHFLLLVAPP